MSRNQSFSHITKLAARWNVAQRFNLAGLIVMVLGTIFISRWVGDQIKTSIINETAAATALYLDSFVTPNLQELGSSSELTPEHAESLNNLLKNTDIGKQIVAIKVWDRDGRVLYSDHPALIGQVFGASEDLSIAFLGSIFASVSDLQDDENIEERGQYKQLLEIYIPVRKNGTHEVIAVAEFYEKIDTLESEINQAQQRSWFAVSAGMGITYLWLVGFFRLARNRIGKQEVALKNHVAQLTEVLSYNNELDERVRRATANAATLNERFLRRIGADLTDGPIKEINLAYSMLEPAMKENHLVRAANPGAKVNQNLLIVQNSLDSSLRDLADLASGLQLPQLEKLSLPEIFTSAVEAHEMRTKTSVDLKIQEIPDQATLSIKITSYRVVQEGLNNAHRHAGGVGQAVRVRCEAHQLIIEVSDRGYGFDASVPITGDVHLGLAGMRERVKSLGGLFSIESKINAGTKITARLFLSDVNTVDSA